MNARQKAKHFKKLYEESLPKKPYPVVYQTVLPIHRKVSVLLEMREVEHLQHNPQLFETFVVNRILRELKPLIWRNTNHSIDWYLDKHRYSIDIWLGTQDREG